MQLESIKSEKFQKLEMKELGKLVGGKVTSTSWHNNSGGSGCDTKDTSTDNTVNKVGYDFKKVSCDATI